MSMRADAASTLVKIKLLHTAAWLFFVTCIFALPIAGQLRRFRLAAALAVIVGIECVVVAANHFQCPLTNAAARYTDDRSANFDIYLPEWLARYNQHIFGTLFLAGILFVLWKWQSSR